MGIHLIDSRGVCICAFFSLCAMGVSAKYFQYSGVPLVKRASVKEENWMSQ